MGFGTSGVCCAPGDGADDGADDGEDVEGVMLVLLRRKCLSVLRCGHKAPRVLSDCVAGTGSLLFPIVGEIARMGRSIVGLR